MLQFFLQKTWTKNDHFTNLRSDFFILIRNYLIIFLIQPPAWAQIRDFFVIVFFRRIEDTTIFPFEIFWPLKEAPLLQSELKNSSLSSFCSSAITEW